MGNYLVIVKYTTAFKFESAIADCTSKMELQITAETPLQAATKAVNVLIDRNPDTDIEFNSIKSKRYYSQ